ncbi:MAG: aminotransferase class I/II-fold pyridoxal phosphate-dependent enzyme [Saprospiraceae bacterium]
MLHIFKQIFGIKTSEHPSAIPSSHSLSSHSLSTRGIIAAKTQLRVDWEIFSEASQNIYDKKDNPDGAFTLNVAENRLSWYLLKEKIEEVVSQHSIPSWVPLYTSCLGAPSFRKVLAGFLAKFVTKCDISPDHIAVSAGASSVIELTSWLVTEKGDVAVFPAPSYSVYKQDINNKSGLERYDLITHSELSEIAEKPIMNIPLLENALSDITSQGKRFRMLVLTTPDNPTGGMYDMDTLTNVADWCIDHHIHLIVNEIYALSLINTKHPDIATDYSHHQDFESFALVMEQKKSDYLHMWYALSKDLGTSGFRVGLLYTHNEDLLQAYDNFNVPHLVSNFTQWVFEVVLSDHAFMECYIKKNQEHLTESYIVVINKLKKLNIPYAPSRGSLFVWLDLSRFLLSQTQEAETNFWEKLYRESGVLLTPGNGFGHSKRGMFRLVYPCHTKEELVVAMDRMERCLF